jgi:geranylgeranyl diphosphate synthase type II
MFDLSSYIKQKRQMVDASLETMIQDSASSPIIVKAMKYSLMAGGKRIRPVLCLAACEAVGGFAKDALTAACALEMVHTYSLIHDDLPAMDDDRLRRGKPTSHVTFDEATAILAGDALLTLAFEILSSDKFDPGHSVSRRLQVIGLISAAAGYQGMIQGQMLDIASEGLNLSAGELENVHRLKTGALIEASLTCGALLGGADSRPQALLTDYGSKIGLAFQVADDILNVEGNPELMGKAVGTDNLRQKSTYPSVLGIRAAKQFSKKLVQEALQALETFGKQADPLRGIARYIIERKR